MIAVEQWRAVVGCFHCSRLCLSRCNCRQHDNHNTYSSQFSKLKCLCCLLVLISSYCCSLLLLISGDVEMNPGPTKLCPNCNVSVHIRTVNCMCGYSFTKCKSKNVIAQRESKRLIMKTKRAVESDEDALIRKNSDKLTKSKKRLLESDEDALIRKNSDMLAKSKKRLFE